MDGVRLGNQEVQHPFAEVHHPYLYHSRHWTRACLRYDTRISVEIGPGCTEKPNYLDTRSTTQSPALDPRTTMELTALAPSTVRSSRHGLFVGPAKLCCQLRRFFVGRQPRPAKNLILNRVLSVFESLLNLYFEFFQRDVSMGCVTTHLLLRYHVFS